MKVAVLTSSRADYSIYLPLLKEMKNDPFFELDILAFGTHVSHTHGYTLDNIKNDGFNIAHSIENFTESDSPKSIADSMGRTIEAFSGIWASADYDLVFALGDRFEMFAAVASAVPFNIRIAHIHGGETTLGAIDDCFRHSITMMSKLHFPVTEQYKNRIEQLTGEKKNIYNVGSLSYDNLKQLTLLSKEEFFQKFNIDLSLPSILITFHPETVSFEKNDYYISELLNALEEVKGYRFIFTMPNADTTANNIRQKITDFAKRNQNATTVESFGTIGYLSCMKHCSFMLGNTSSGFAEAAYFPKYVINLGDRQKGRIVTENIYNCSIKKEEILKAVNAFESVKLPSSIPIYGDGDSAKKIVRILKDSYGKF
ncbi:MAG: UDP-N-acetyl-D-glucosamine 2-epimerase [Bacteroidetes bacterium]|nr:UDP-N-acetyl-D-glucosamine 2-epimerase [Bacteroidota bacterium]